MTGIFITFEGGEGGGKSTQSKLLGEFFQSIGKSVVLTREPGGTKGAEDIRSLLVKGETDKWDHVTETLLHLAARRDHVEKIIKPALAKGEVVICDRFCDSTLAYQGYGHGLGVEYINNMQKLVIGDFRPDLTFILDIDPKAGITRAGSRGDKEDRYEKMGSGFHDRVRNGFLNIAQAEPNRCHVIDANRPIEEIHKAIVNICKD